MVRILSILKEMCDYDKKCYNLDIIFKDCLCFKKLYVDSY